MTNNTKWMTMAEVAEEYACSERSIRRLIAAGTLPAYRLGNRTVRIKRVDAEALAQPIRPA